MSLRYKFKKAAAIIRRLNSAEEKKLARICRDIQAAEEALLLAAEENLEKCIAGCAGLCCRNARIDEIIGLMDCIYLLAAYPELQARIRECLPNENLLYSADCIFLENGTGPCLFPFNARPEVCITTFCSDTAAVRKEIRRVKMTFMRLTVFVVLRQPRRWVGRILNRRKYHPGGRLDENSPAATGSSIPERD